MSSFSSSSALNKPRYHGNITIEMIDDYLNPFLNGVQKKEERRSKVKFVPPPTTSGLGLPSEKATNIVRKSNHPELSNFDYVQQNKRQYERELKEERVSYSSKAYEFMNFPEQPFDAQNSQGSQSVVGSAMSQIESVTTMNISAGRKKELMKHAAGLTKMYHNEDTDLIGDENNNFGMQEMQKMIEESKKMIEQDKDVDKQKKLDELCQNFDFKPKVDVNLPITDKRSKLINFLGCYNYSIIQGNTGSLLKSL